MAESDVALCVLSLPDVITEDGICLPEHVKELVNPSTFVLLNKIDLASPSDIVKAERALSACAGTWTISLSSGKGLEKFLGDFGQMMNEKCVLFFFTLGRI